MDLEHGKISLPTPKEAYEVNKIFYMDDPVSATLALIHLHSEVSEVFQRVRTHGLSDKYTGPGTGCLAEELADIVLVTLSLSGYLDIDLEKAILDKHEYNINRNKLNAERKEELTV